MFKFKRFKLKKEEYVIVRKDILEDIIHDSVMISAMVSENPDLNVHNVTVGEIMDFESNCGGQYRQIVNAAINIFEES